MAEKWAKRSLPPSSGVMNPKPFASLNHFTLPVAMSLNSWKLKRRSRLFRAPLAGTMIKGGNLTATTGAALGGEEGKVHSLLEYLAARKVTHFACRWGPAHSFF